jgi:orotate phosphoribosyltransferase
MDFYKSEFCRFLLESNALKIGCNPDREDGNFVLKSGRISPFFMNMGDLNDGKQLLELG